jgi:hypothetical protein
MHEAGVIETVGLGFTCTVDAVEFIFDPALSVTWTMKFQLPVPVEIAVAKVKLTEFVPTAT